MSAIFNLGSSDLNVGLIEKIRSLAKGRNVTIVVHVQDSTLDGHAEGSGGNDAVLASRALDYAQTVFKELDKQQLDLVEEIMGTYQRTPKVDLSNFKFNREEANER